MKWNNIKITIFKELRGIVRDKKSLQKLIIYPLLIPLVLLLFGVLFDSVNESKYTVGVNYTLTEEEKEIIKEFENLSVKTYSTKEELKDAYVHNKVDGYIVRKNNIYEIYYDGSQNSGEVVYSLTSSYLDSYNRILGTQELLKNNIDPNKVFRNIVIEEKSLVKNDSNVISTVIFSLVITYLIMIVVMVCVVVVTDATSGEKERGTLETVLTFPIRTIDLILGKYLATSILSFIVGSISYLLSIPTIYIGKGLFKSYEEISFSTNIGIIFLVIFIIFLSSLLSAGVCMALAGKAKTYKEAQSSLQFISLLPMIPYFLKMMEIDSFIFNLIPIANCGSLLNNVIMNHVDYSSLFIIVATTILYTVCIIIYISNQYKKEEVLFS